MNVKSSKIEKSNNTAKSNIVNCEGCKAKRHIDQLYRHKISRLLYCYRCLSTQIEENVNSNFRDCPRCSICNKKNNRMYNKLMITFNNPLNNERYSNDLFCYNCMEEIESKKIFKEYEDQGK